MQTLLHGLPGGVGGLWGWNTHWQLLSSTNAPPVRYQCVITDLLRFSGQQKTIFEMRRLKKIRMNSLCYNFLHPCFFSSMGPMD
jgi:hypothetical protein